MKIKFIVGLFLIVNFLNAHSVREVNYLIDLKNSPNTLKIHLTPKGAIDILKHIKPELESEAVFDFKMFNNEFEKYFNDNVTITSNNLKLNLRFLKSNLLEHDSSIEFEILDFNNSVEKLYIEITAFIYIYKKVKNHINLTHKEGVFNIVLDKNDRTTSIILKSSKEEQKENPKKIKPNYFIIICSIILVVIIILIAFYFIKQR